MNPLPLSLARAPRSTASLTLVPVAMVGMEMAVGCSSTTTAHDAGNSGGSGGSGAGGSASGTGGKNGTGGADAGTDMRVATGMGGTVILVDASSNSYTCANLLACCNSTTNTALENACLQQYNAANGSDATCNNVLTQIKANNLCL